MGHPRPLFVYFHLFKQTLQFLQQTYVKKCYDHMVPGFEPTTFGTRVSSNNHQTRAPTLCSKVIVINLVDQFKQQKSTYAITDAKMNGGIILLAKLLPQNFAVIHSQLSQLWQSKCHCTVDDHRKGPDFMATSGHAISPEIGWRSQRRS